MDRPSAIGALIGFVVSILFVFIDWKAVLFVIGLTLVGYIGGRYLESQGEVKDKIRELLYLLFR